MTPALHQHPTAGLVWRDTRHYDHRSDKPCALCGRPTPLRAHSGEPAHKVCAEQWAAAHHDDRFVSDPPTRSRTHT